MGQCVFFFFFNVMPLFPFCFVQHMTLKYLCLYMYVVHRYTHTYMHIRHAFLIGITMGTCIAKIKKKRYCCNIYLPIPKKTYQGFFFPNFSRVAKRNFNLPSYQSAKNYNFDFMGQNKESMLESDKKFMGFQLSIYAFFFLCQLQGGRFWKNKSEIGSYNNIL